MQKLRELWPQVYKFLLIGGLNTAIHFAVYNFLIFITKDTEAFSLMIFTTTAFIFANINSYVFNKNWTFKDSESQEEAKKFSAFFVVSLVGLLLNVLIVYSIIKYIPDFLGVPAILHIVGGKAETLWANVALLAATLLALVWNFIGYKFIVFKK